MKLKNKYWKSTTFDRPFYLQLFVVYFNPLQWQWQLVEFEIFDKSMLHYLVHWGRELGREFQPPFSWLWRSCTTIIASPFSNLLWTPEMFKILQFLVEFCPQRPKLRSWGFSVAGNILYDFNLPSSFLSVLQRSKVLTMSIVIVQILRPGRVRRNNSSSRRRNLDGFLTRFLWGDVTGAWVVRL